VLPLGGGDRERQLAARMGLPSLPAVATVALAAHYASFAWVLAGTTLGALLSGLFSLWNFGLLFAIDPGLAVAATVLVVIALIPAVLATRYGLKRQRTVAEIDGKIEGLLLQFLTGITKLRVTAAESRA